MLHVRRLSFAQKVLLTCALVGAVTTIRYLVGTGWPPGISFVLYHPVVIFCSWMGGLATGLLATGLSAVSIILLSLRYTNSDLGYSLHGLSALVLDGVIISVAFNHLLRRIDREYAERLCQMQTFVNEAPVAMAMFDRKMRYVAVSRRWLADFHLGEIDLIGRSHYEVFPEMSQRWKDVHQRCLAGAVEKESEALFVRADGSQQGVSWEVRPWMTNVERGEIGGVLIFSEDLAATRRAREQEIALRAQAEVARLRQLEADKLMKAKDDFVATLSHELRTPLNAMLGWTQLLKRFSHDPQRLRQAMDAIERSGQILSQLVSDILDINRITSGKLKLNLSPIAVDHLLEHSINALQPEIELKELTLVQHLDVQSVTVRGDSMRLQQCVWNLLSNAIKFTAPGGTITVSAYARGEDLRISVADTGCGIQPELLPTLFERLMQVEAPGTRVNGGLGLGLAIVRHLVELHGGSVSAYSAGLGTGSEFTITLPLGRSTATAPTVVDESGAAITSAAPQASAQLR